MSDEKFVVAVNRSTMMVLLSDNSTLPITTLIDSDGQETNKIDEASTFVAGRDGVGWYAGDIDDFPPGFIN